MVQSEASLVLVNRKVKEHHRLSNEGFVHVIGGDKVKHKVRIWCLEFIRIHDQVPPREIIERFRALEGAG